ncbi:MAG TPA: PASTA domain-containing protein [Caldithrix abyssi]|uniref:PASTA domain-containing protein n=1 Tax=Caldithrix abyssi TaxID=187145 RepID=A0A7V4U3Y3_CALAY|nr:PASTA domain-containing protein [Caldithrix abyssi]
MSKSAKISRIRLFFLASAVVLFWLLIEANLFRVQILMHDRFDGVAQRQYEKKIVLPARRGAICDVNGNKLATTIIQYDIAADPIMIADKTRVAQACARSFGRPTRYYLTRLERKSHFVFLERRVSDERAGKLLKLDDPGLIKTPNFRRFYPFKTYGAHLLGFTDPDDRGLSGIELQFDEYLRGRPGEAVLQYDGPRRVYYDADHPIKKAQPGADLFLTIDKNIQTVVEQELADGVRRVKAKSGMAVVMDPFSGAILAMANYPEFDPNRHSRFPEDAKRNRCITDVFEPGSTMKIMTAAALLQEGIYNKDSIVHCNNGKYKVYDRVFRDTKKHGWLSFQRVVEKSSNVGMIRLAEKLPPRTLFRYLKNFGFGMDTGIGLQGANPGRLEQPARWSGVSRASISIGYEIGVTAVHLAAAYSAVVNGGYLYRPFVISRLRYPDGREEILNEPEQIRQVISEPVSRQLKLFMKGVVERGTGTKARVDGLTVGGKTGTAKKYDRKNKRYYSNKYIASFVGFADFEMPRFVVAVIIDEPQTYHYGGSVAAPVFSRIVQRIFYFEQPIAAPGNIAAQTEYAPAEEAGDLPPLNGFRIESARALLDEKDMDYKLAGQGVFVKEAVLKDNTVILNTTDALVQNNRVPKLTGLTLREALDRVNLQLFKITLQGQKKGIVRSQRPRAGTRVKKRTELVLVCE